MLACAPWALPAIFVATYAVWPPHLDHIDTKTWWNLHAIRTSIVASALATPPAILIAIHHPLAIHITIAHTIVLYCHYASHVRFNLNEWILLGPDYVAANNNIARFSQSYTPIPWLLLASPFWWANTHIWKTYPHLRFLALTAVAVYALCEAHRANDLVRYQHIVARHLTSPMDALRDALFAQNILYTNCSPLRIKVTYYDIALIDNNRYYVWGFNNGKRTSIQTEHIDTVISHITQ